MYDGYCDREKRAREQTGYFVAAIMNACGHLKRPIKLEQLIGSNGKEKVKKIDAETKRRELELLKAHFNAKG